MAAKARHAHIFNRAAADHYVEPSWVSQRLFEVERFAGTIVDAACGWGRILASAQAAGYPVLGLDLVDRGAAQRVPGLTFQQADFLRDPIALPHPCAIVCNPPFDQIKPFALKALELAHQVAM